MTRREEVTNKVKEIVHESGYNAIPSTLFEMATWADKTMINKVCEWLKAYANDFGVPESESGRVYVDDLVAELTEAMEE